MVKWGEFKVNKLFEVEGTKSLDSNAIDFTDKGINFVGRTFYNNGIQGKIQKQFFEPNNPNTITATVIGNYKYVKLQKEYYYCSQNINKLTPNSNIKIWNDNIAYFLISNIQKFVSLYDFQQGGYKLEDIKNHKIQLPIKDNKIDFDFIENFIAELKKQQILKVKNYLAENGLSDFDLTKKEKQVLEDHKDLDFNDFKLTDEFEVKNTGNVLGSDIIENSGKIPYLCASSENNGVSSYINYDTKKLDKGNCVFIGGKTFVVSYQGKDFFSNDSHNLVLDAKNIPQKSKLNQLYLATCINKSLGYKYSWGDSISNKKIQKDFVGLPVKDKQPNYEIMETFISAIQKLVIKDVVLYVEQNLKTEKMGSR